MDLMLLTLATFTLVTTLTLAGYYLVTAEAPVETRLKRFAGEPLPTAKRARSQTRPGLLRRALLALGQYGFGGADSSLAHTISVAGFRSASSTTLFLGVRTLLSFGPALLILVPQVSAGKPMGRTLWIAGGAWVFGHVVTTLWLSRRARRRVSAIGQALPDALDLMVVCLEAGLGLNATIARVGEERATMDDPLGSEFAQVAFELRSGRSREEALRALGDRNGVDDLKALAALVIQSDRLGASMAKTLRVHADMLRTKRRQRAEEAARKLPIKMIFPLAFFILPPLFVVTAGPAMLTFAAFVKVMTQH